MYEQQNLYPSQGGPVQGTEPLMQPISQTPIYGQQIPPAVQPIPQPQINQPISQPVFQAPFVNQQQPIVVNQYMPDSLTLNLKTSPTVLVCPFCKNNITTIVDTEFNIVNFCFCWFFFYIWIIAQLIRRKQLLCIDATHKCPSCGSIIGKYSSC